MFENQVGHDTFNVGNDLARQARSIAGQADDLRKNRICPRFPARKARHGKCMLAVSLSHFLGQSAGQIPEETTVMYLILLVILLLLLLGALPAWPYSRGWGYYPSGGLGLLLVILLVLFLMRGV